MVAQSGCHRSGFGRRREVHQQRVEGWPGRSKILPISFDIVVQPCSIITARNRALSPAAKLLYDHILAEIR